MFCGTAEWISSLGDEVVVEIDLREVLGVGIEPFGCGGEHGSLSGGWRLSGVPQMPGNTSDQAKNRWRLRLVELLSGRVALEFATQLVKPHLGIFDCSELICRGLGSNGNFCTLLVQPLLNVAQLFLAVEDLVMKPPDLLVERC